MNVYEIINDRIMGMLKNGVVPWRKKWTGTTSGAYNMVSKKPYSLLNQCLLKHNDAYLTFKQVNKLKGSVNKGAKSELVTYWNITKKEYKKDGKTVLDEDGKPVMRNIPILRYYRVFWVGDTTLERVELPKKDTGEIRQPQNIINNYLAREKTLKFIDNQPSDQAYYSPSRDIVVLPQKDQFDTMQDYYDTAFHELIHSTGISTRCNRGIETNQGFGSESYSKEELVAETGSAYLDNLSGISSNRLLENNAAYIQSWLNALENDPKMFVSACSRAEKACKYIING